MQRFKPTQRHLGETINPRYTQGEAHASVPSDGGRVALPHSPGRGAPGRSLLHCELPRPRGEASSQPGSAAGQPPGDQGALGCVVARMSLHVLSYEVTDNPRDAGLLC